MTRLSRVATLSLVLLLAALSCEDNPAAPAGPDTTPPAIRLVEAVDSYHVLITFSEPVDPLWAANYNTYRIETDDDEYLGLFSASMQGSRKVYLSTIPMAAVRYDLTVGHVEDLQGNAADDLVASFNGSTAKDVTPPIIAEHTPRSGAAGAPLDEAVDVIFSEAVTIHDASMTIQAGGEPLPTGVIGWNGYAQYKLFAPLHPATTYTVTISGVRDFGGNSMPTVAWSFTTTSTPDVTRPELVTSSPFDRQENVPLDSWITIYFSEMIDRDSFAPVFSPPTDGVSEWWPDGQQFRFRPATPLNPETEYMITFPVGGYRDVAGNTSAEPDTIRFTTGPASGTVMGRR